MGSGQLPCLLSLRRWKLWKVILRLGLLVITISKKQLGMRSKKNYVRYKIIFYCSHLIFCFTEESSAWNPLFFSLLMMRSRIFVRNLGIYGLTWVILTILIFINHCLLKEIRIFRGRLFMKKLFLSSKDCLPRLWNQFLLMVCKSLNNFLLILLSSYLSLLLLRKSLGLLLMPSLIKPQVWMIYNAKFFKAC